MYSSTPKTSSEELLPMYNLNVPTSMFQSSLKTYLSHITCFVALESVIQKLAFGSTFRRPHHRIKHVIGVESLPLHVGGSFWQCDQLLALVTSNLCRVNRLVTSTTLTILILVFPLIGLTVWMIGMWIRNYMQMKP